MAAVHLYDLQPDLMGPVPLVPLCSPHVFVDKAPRGHFWLPPYFPPLPLLIPPPFFFSPIPFIPGSGDLMKSLVTIGDLFQSLCHRPLPFVRLQFTLWSSGCFLRYVLPASPDLITEVHFHILFFC